MISLKHQAPFLFSLCLSSCTTVGPDYEEPFVKVPDAWTESIATDQRRAFNGSQLWWKKFNDSSIHSLITLAKTQNPNIKIAASRIIEGWHQRHVLSAAWYPNSNINAKDNYGLLTYDNNQIDWEPNSSHSQLAQLDVGWEIDFFGRVKRQVEAAEAEYASRIEGMRDISVFIYSEVVLHYIAYRTLEKRLNTSYESIGIFKKIKQIINERLEEGISSELELAEATARLNASEAEIPRLKQELKTVELRLANILGLQPKDIKPYLKKNRSIPTPPYSIATGSPADLLRSRPDIRRAERKIAAQSARIGIATANLYPQLSISGALTYEYLRQGVSVQTLNRVLGLGPSLKWRIFNANADKHRIKENEAKLTQAIDFYEKTILNAITDVEVSITRLDQTKKRYKKLTRARDNFKKAADLMFDAYDTGEVDLRRLLNAHRDYIFYKDECHASKGRIAAHAVRLYKALGGGVLPSPGDPKRSLPTHPPKFPAQQF